MKVFLGALFLMALAAASAISLMVGKYISWGGEAHEYEKYGFQLVSITGSWISALATLAAVITAMYTVHRQIKSAERISCEERLESKLHADAQCYRYSMSLVIRMRNRLHSLKMTMVYGNRPVYVLVATAEKFTSLYDQLFERENVNRLPGPLIDAIESLSGSVFGVEMLTHGINVMCAENGVQNLPALNAGAADLEKKLVELGKELDNLCDKFEKAYSDLNRTIAEHNARQ